MSMFGGSVEKNVGSSAGSAVAADVQMGSGHARRALGESCLSGRRRCLTSFGIGGRESIAVNGGKIVTEKEFH
jgi:hypothetical protein